MSHQKLTVMKILYSELVCFLALSVITVFFSNSINAQQPTNEEKLLTALLGSNHNRALSIVQQEIDVNYYSEDSMSLLMYASNMGYKDICVILIDKGADVDFQGKGDWTALMIASSKGHKDMVTLLMEKGAKVNILNKEGVSALILALLSDNPEIAKILIENGADADIQTINGTTSLMLATSLGYADIVKLLEKILKSKFGIEDIDCLLLFS